MVRASTSSLSIVEDTRRQDWERRSEWPLTVLAVLFLAAYAAPILAPRTPDRLHSALTASTWLIWAGFAADYLIRWRLSSDRRQFVRSNVLDLVVIALPLLRPLRALRLLTLLDVLNRRAATSLRGQVAVYVVGATTLILFCAALAVLDAERRNPDANIKDFPDALWWAATTVTTVGYGDRYPTTPIGRTVAVLLMLGGIALLGIVTAALASWLLDRIREAEIETRAATREDIHLLLERIDHLQEEIQQLRPNHSPPTRPPTAPQGPTPWTVADNLPP